MQSVGHKPKSSHVCSRPFQILNCFQIFIPIRNLWANCRGCYYDNECKHKKRTNNDIMHIVPIDVNQLGSYFGSLHKGPIKPKLL